MGREPKSAIKNTAIVICKKIPFVFLGLSKREI